MAEADLVSRCALCGNRHPSNDPGPWSRPRYWCGDETDDGDRTDLICDCQMRYRAKDPTNG